MTIDKERIITLSSDEMFVVHPLDDVSLVMNAARTAMARLLDLFEEEIEHAVGESDVERAMVLSYSHGLYAAAVTQLEGYDLPGVEEESDS